MTYVIAGSCIKDDSCVEVCPVDCIHPKPGAPDFETAEQLYIDPEVCIDCDACVEACPVDAIFPEAELPQKFALRARAQRASSSPSGSTAERTAADPTRVASRSSAPGRPARSPPPRCCAPAATWRSTSSSGCPTPWGLLRGGVAPDHQEIKRLDDTLRPRDAPARLPLPRQRRGRHRHLPRRADASTTRPSSTRPARRPTSRSASRARTCPAAGPPPSSSPGTTATPTTATSSSTSRRGARW